MGLDVGVARIRYNHTPARGPAYEFAEYLRHHCCDADWGFQSGPNVLVEYTRSNMLDLLARHADTNGLGAADRTRALGWVNGLPWEGDTIMLHFGW